jgi:DNA polymerase-4
VRDRKTRQEPPAAGRSGGPAPGGPSPGALPSVMHLDIDAFFASVEQVVEPRLRDLPVIVGHGVIASCSYEARRYGLHAGMPMRDALRLCPHAVVRDGHYQVYRCFARRIFDACLDVAPTLETYLDETYGDLSGTHRLHGDPVEAMRRLQARVRRETGLSVTIGLGANRMAARMVGRTVKPGGVALLPPGREAEFIAPRPVRDLPGVGPRSAAVLESLNVHTIGELGRISEGALRSLFGENGAALYQRCRGRDTRAVEAREIPRSISRETSFHRETIDRVEVEGMLYYLCERAARTLRELGVLARTLSLKLRYADFQGEATSRSLARPTSADEELYRLALRLLESAWTRRAALRLVGLSLTRLVACAGRQTDLLAGERMERLERLYRGIDHVRRRYGHGSIVAGRSLDLLAKLSRDRHGYVLRTPSLTK